MTRDKRIDLQKRQTNRNVFLCHLVGPQGAGKTSFMKGFLGNNLQQSKQKSSQKNKISPFSNYVVNDIQIYGQRKYLIVEYCFHFHSSNTSRNKFLIYELILIQDSRN